MARLAERWHRFSELYHKEIWQQADVRHSPLRCGLYTILRIFSITTTVFGETKAASRAAALSFSSLLGFGPMIAIAMVVAGMVVDQKDPNLAVNALNRMIKFVAPQVGQYETMTAGSLKQPSASSSDLAQVIAPAPTLDSGQNPEPARAAAPTATAPITNVNPGLVQLINGVVAGSRSSTAGALGALTLIFIVILLFKSIEDTFNEIWGVREGRSWLMRIIYYWTILTLGAVIFFAAVTLLSAGAFINVFIERLPYGNELLSAARWMLPLASGTLVVVMLTLFYRYIPNTHVFWRSALIGAVIVALLLLLNNYLAFIYVRRVVLSKSLYGSLGILPILMFGLYVFWLYVLIGGQISYAVQNVHFRSSQNAWSTLSSSTRERLCLIVLLTIGRRWQNCLPASTTSQLSAMIKVPTQILNECINLLVDMKLITPIPPNDADPSTDFLYQPARPLNHITLGDFKKRLENHGENPTSETIDALDPVQQGYNSALQQGWEGEFFQKPLDRLFAEHDFEGSRPPFTFGKER
ncbi:MAG: YihY/virulence factor BrkB family protein [Cephaloticoccus sp.]|nr:YihY/virulence factor BrkB family protein [Cephaloticoccus sp.]MCF7759304.1 YihY/virulence factor BrkB family protein [Cephaloticoccus sp.]